MSKTCLRPTSVTTARSKAAPCSPLRTTIAGLLRPRASASLIATTLALATGVSAQENAAPAKSTGSSEVLEEVTVRAVSFKYEAAESATKMPLSVKDTPQAVTVVTQDLIEFAGIKQFEDIFKIDASGGSSQAGDQFPRNYFRGFPTQGINAIKVDGFRMPADIQLDLAPFERFEVVKGPTSTLYGQNSLAGTLNAVSKSPKDEFGGEISVEMGSYNHYRGDIDLYGPLGAGDALSYRLVAAYLDEEEFVDFTYNKRTVIAPTLKYQIDEGTSITLRLDYQDFDFTPYYGSGAQFLGDDITDPAQLTGDNFRLPDVPRSRAGNTPYNFADKQARLVVATLDHRFGDSSWTMRANLQRSDLESHLRGNLMFGTDRDGFTDNEIYLTEADDEMYSGEVNLFGDVEAFGREHTLFLGVDYAHIKHKLDNYYTDMFGIDTGFSLFDPDYSLLAPPAGPEGYENFYAERFDRTMSGATVQALLHPADGLTVSLGARYSHDLLDSRTPCCDQGVSLDSVPEDHQEENEVTYQAGITYALNDAYNVYVSYGQTFEPQTGFISEGVHLKPLAGDSYEIGMKGTLIERRLFFSLALFSMELSNIAEDIPGTPWSAPAGTQRSRGVELDFQGEVIDGLSIYGSLAALDAEYIEGDFKGIKPVNAPKFGASLFLSYELQNGALRGLGAGGGVVYKHDLSTSDISTYGANTPVTFLDDICELDLRVFYTWQNWQFEIAGSNLLNEEYASNAFSQLGLGFNMNPPRQVIGSVRYRF